MWVLPLLPRNSKRSLEPEISTWRSCRVVSPNERLDLAYSSLPTRMQVHSSSRTTVASTFSRGSPGWLRSRSSRCADLRQRLAEAPACGRTWSRPGPPATWGDSGTASALARPGRWPGCGRWDWGRSTRRCRPAESPASGSGTAPWRHGSSSRPFRRTRIPCRLASGGFPAACRSRSAGRRPERTRPDR